MEEEGRRGGRGNNSAVKLVYNDDVHDDDDDRIVTHSDALKLRDNRETAKYATAPLHLHLHLFPPLLLLLPPLRHFESRDLDVPGRARPSSLQTFVVAAS